MANTLSQAGLFLAVSAIMLSSCSSPASMEVNISNTSDMAINGETVEIPVSDIIERLGNGYYKVVCDGEELPSQLTHDSLFVFQVNLEPKASTRYTITVCESMPVYDSVAVGRIYPERADDLAWENDLVGFRAYGPATQAKGERAFGYDIFFKHPNKRPIVADLYAAQTSRENWHIADSLRKISKEQAEEFINSFTYHKDHGLGMDCYAVGPTLGDGVAARLVNDSIAFTWCYETAEILDNGPVRFSVLLKFAPVDGVAETRRISLDAGKHLNACTVSYSGISDSTEIVVGVPRRDDSEAISGTNYLAYADPTQGKDNGKAMLGVFVPDRDVVFEEREGHIVLRTAIAPDEDFRYYFGFAWDKADINNMTEWDSYLKSFKHTPLIVSY